jgi:hypothetical protein
VISIKIISPITDNEADYYIGDYYYDLYYDDDYDYSGPNGGQSGNSKKYIYSFQTARFETLILKPGRFFGGALFIHSRFFKCPITIL